MNGSFVPAVLHFASRCLGSEARIRRHGPLQGRASWDEALRLMAVSRKRLLRGTSDARYLTRDDQPQYEMAVDDAEPTRIFLLLNISTIEATYGNCQFQRP
jgi:hypothetical protein